MTTERRQHGNMRSQKKAIPLTANRSNTDKHPRVATLRDTGAYSTRNASKGAMIDETGKVFGALADGITVEEVREAVLTGTLLPHASRTNREAVWDRIHYRYLTHRIPWILSALTDAYQQGMRSPEFVSLCYLHYALRDRLTLDFVTEALWHKGYHSHPLVRRNDVLDLLDQRVAEHPETQRWADTSRVKVAGSILTALRDFGLLEGKQKKYLVRPILPVGTAAHLLRILTAEGRRGREVIDEPTWRLFMLNDEGVAAALSKLPQEAGVHFEKVGVTVVLQTPPEWEDQA